MPAQPPPVSMFRKVMTGPKYIAGLVVAAIIPVVAIGALGHFNNAVGADFDYVVTYDNEVGTDFSRVVPATVPAEQVKDLLAGRRYFEVGASSSVKVGEQGIKLTVSGKRSDRLKIVGMRALVIETGPPVAGTLFSYGAEGTPNVNLGFDLKAPIPSARTVGKNGQLGEPYFRTTSEPLDLSSSTTFGIIAYPGPHTYTWEIELQLVVEGKSQTKRISGPEGPFKVSGYAGKYQAAYQWTGESDDNQWTALDSSDTCKIVAQACQQSR